MSDRKLKTLGEFIAELQQFDPSIPVVTRGYDEEGVAIADCSPSFVYIRKHRRGCSLGVLGLSESDPSIFQQPIAIGKVVCIDIGKNLNVEDYQ